MSLIDKALKANKTYAKKYDWKLGGHPSRLANQLAVEMDQPG